MGCQDIGEDMDGRDLQRIMAFCKTVQEQR